MKAEHVDDLRSACLQFQRWTGTKKMFTVYKSGSPIAEVYRKPFTSDKFCVTLKREWYRNFSRDFPHVPDKGWGQITSLKLLLFCEQEGINNLVAVMPDGVGYVCDVGEFLRYYYEHHTDVEAAPGHEHLEGEVASPITMWKRLYPAP